MKSLRFVVHGLLGWLVCGCSGDSAEPHDDGTRDVDLLLSAPIPGSHFPGHAVTGSLVFVGARPGVSPRAARILAHGMRGDTAMGVARNGGFDPFPIAARENDVLTVTFVDSSERRTTTRVLVKPRPPRLVRVYPVPHQTDVPLNVRILVVFSAPMNASSGAQGVQLLRSGSVVPATVRPTSDALAFELIPASQLEVATDYEVQVAATVQDILGTPVAEAAIAPFRTGTTSAAVSELDMDGHVYPFLNSLVDFWRLEIGQAIDLRALVDGSPGQPVVWSSSDPSVARVTERAPGFAIETGMRPGQAWVSVEFGGARQERLVEVFSQVPGDLLGTMVLYMDRYDRLTRYRPSGPVETQLMSERELPPDPTLCPDIVTDRCFWNPHRYAVGPAEQVAVTRASDIGGVWIKDNPQGQIRRVNSPSERGAANTPHWSPTGAQLAYWFDFYDLAMTELRVVNADGTGQRVLLRVPYDTNAIQSLGVDRVLGGKPFVWHPDGRRLLVATGEGTLQVATDGSGQSLYLAGYQPGPWFPDGQAQFVYQWVRTGSGNIPRIFLADALGRVDQASAVDGNYEGPPVAVSEDGGLWATYRTIYTRDRRASYAVFADAALNSVVGFGP